MSYSSKSNVGPQIANPGNVNESSISNNTVTKMLPLLDFHNFGHNTLIRGRTTGEVLEANDTDIDTYDGMAIGSKKLDYVGSSELQPTNVSISESLIDSYNYLMLSGYHIFPDDTNKTTSLNKLSITVSNISSIPSYVIDTPILFSFKTYNTNSKKVAAFGPMFIPYVGNCKEYFAYRDVSTAKTCNINESFFFDRTIVSNGSMLDKPSGDHIGTSAYWGSNNDTSLKWFEVSYELKSGSDLTNTSLDIRLMVDDARWHSSGHMHWTKDEKTITLGQSYSQRDNHYGDQVWNIRMRFNWTKDGVSHSAYMLYKDVKVWNNEWLNPVRHIAPYNDRLELNPSGSPLWIRVPVVKLRHHKYRSIQSITILPHPDMPVGVTFTMTFETNKGKITKHVTTGITDNTYSSTKIPSYKCTLIDNKLKDPLLECSNDSDLYYGDVETFYVEDTTNDLTIDMDVTTISNTKTIDTSGRELVSTTCIGNITNITCGGLIAPRANKQLIIAKGESQINISSTSTIKNIIKLSSRYTLTHVSSGNTYYYGVYDSIEDRHYSPNNLSDITEYLPKDSEVNIRNLNIITNNDKQLSFILKYDTNEIYYSIIDLDKFDLIRLFRDDSNIYSNNKVLSAYPIVNGKLIYKDTNTIIDQQWNSIPLDVITGSKEILMNTLVGNGDIAYMKGDLLNIRVSSGNSIMSITNNYTHNNIGVIYDTIEFVSSANNLPMLFPSIFIHSQSTGTSNTTEFTDGYGDLASLVYKLKRLMMYDWSNSLQIGTLVLGEASTGTAVVIKTPAIDELKKYTVMPEKLHSYINIQDLSLLGSCGTGVISIGLNTFSIVNNNIYKSSMYKLVPQSNSKLLDNDGYIRQTSNIIMTSNDKSTVFYSTDKNGNMYYMLSIPDIAISNIVSMGESFIVIGSFGIYRISSTNYNLIYKFNTSMGNAVIKAVGSAGFLAYIYNDKYSETSFNCIDGNYAINPSGYFAVRRDDSKNIFFSIGRDLSVIRLSNPTGYTSRLFNAINTDRSITESITLVDKNSGDVKVVDFFNGVDTTPASLTVRPIYIPVQDGIDFMVSRFRVFYTKLSNATTPYDISFTINIYKTIDSSDSITSCTSNIPFSTLNINENVVEIISINEESLSNRCVRIEFSKGIGIARLEAIGHYKQF